MLCFFALHSLVGGKTLSYASAEVWRPKLYFLVSTLLCAPILYVHIWCQVFGSISKRGLDILSVGGPTLYHLQNADITLQASRTTAFRSRTHQGDKQSFTTNSQVNMQCFFALHYSVGEETLWYTSIEFRRPNYILWPQHFYVQLYRDSPHFHLSINLGYSFGYMHHLFLQ